VTASRRGGRRDDGGDGLAGGATVRGVALVAVAVLVGVVLLGKGFDTGFVPSTGGSSNDEQADDGNDDGDDNGNDDGDGTTTTETVPPTTHQPAQVRVIVLNGGGPSGAAGTSSTALAADGYITLDAGNTDPAVPASAVYFAPTFEADAAAVAARLNITAVPVALPNPPPNGAPAGQVDVVVTLGPDFTPIA
jgi:hypothetical protein